MNFKRARNKEQIMSRKKEIQDACKKLYLEFGFDRVSLKAISNMTSIARSTIYLYYRNKEEIFFDLMIEDGKQWIDEMNDAYKKIGNKNPSDAFKEVLLNFFISRKNLVKVYSLYFSIIQENVRNMYLIEYNKQTEKLFQESIYSWLILINKNTTSKQLEDFRLLFYTFANGVYTTTLGDEEKYIDICKKFIDILVASVEIN